MYDILKYIYYILNSQTFSLYRKNQENLESCAPRGLRGGVHRNYVRGLINN